ncbi:Transposase InsO and inactivated derivatives [Oscillibacter sp. PC13]|uniref:IS3 family transposase n=1 Tax=Oscillibacter sp. PC13 TaxID=1855299 RepID=UPI0008EF47A6|nr:IS3 family transposase [Oscillibacter sp. PC13]SFO94005.1 Transposase InsO and inactivated derivatives [Oscillibacter sp. PC13]
MPIQYPKIFIQTVIQRYEKGEEIKCLSQELHISQSTIYHWRKLYCSLQTPQRTYTPKEFDAISRRLQKPEHILEIIRLSGYLTEIPLLEKLTTLESIYHQLDNQYSVYELCEALDVARGIFYNHIFRRVDRSSRKAEQAQLMLKVQQIFDNNGQRFGSEKIRAILAGSGIRVSAKRISAIMKELDLHSIRPDAKKQLKKRQQYVKQNLLERQFSAEHPNQIWVSDITYFKVNPYWVYLCTILDLYSRKIVGYRVSRNASTNLVTTTFQNAYQERGRPKSLTFHSDRGKQYTSAALTQLLQKHGMKQSFSATARPHDNAIAEAFFASFKNEEAYRQEYTSEQNFRISVEQYIQFYNEVRPHQTLKYQTPQAFEDAYQAVL